MADPGHVQAEDIDDVVQALAVAKYALEAHDEAAAGEAIDVALAKARGLLSAAADAGYVRSRPAS